VSSSALSWPKRERWSGQTYWLSSGQRSLLFWLESRMAKGHHSFTLDLAAAAVGIDRSTVSRALDRLASLSLIGRRSTRGRLGRTVTWRIGRTRALAERASRAAQPVRNVATSTPYGGYLSREALAERSGGVRSGVGSARRLAPPRLLYARCPAGHRVRLSRWQLRRSPDGSRVDGTWKGWCRRCGAWHAELVTLEVPVPDGAQMEKRRRDRANAWAAGRMSAAEFRAAEDADRAGSAIRSAGDVARSRPVARRP
jgi:hypothetical protein